MAIILQRLNPQTMSRWKRQPTTTLALKITDFVAWIQRMKTNEIVSKFLKVVPGVYFHDLGPVLGHGADPIYVLERE